MTKPPSQLDTAQVLYWAWAGNEPFRRALDKENSSYTTIYGLAICFLDGTIYSFACDQNWNVIFDSDFSSIQGAMKSAGMQNPDRQILWQKLDDTDVEKLIADSRLVRYYQETGERQVIQKVLDHLKSRGCRGMVVQMYGENTWELSVWKKDVEIAQEFIAGNIK